MTSFMDVDTSRHPSLTALKVFMQNKTPFERRQSSETRGAFLRESGNIFCLKYFWLLPAIYSMKMCYFSHLFTFIQTQIFHLI